MKKKDCDIEIVKYSEDLREYIKLLNYEWLEKYFKVEEGDVKSLSNPKEEIIDKGGFIFYAKLNDEVVGTVSLLKKDEETFELSKMAVSDKAKGIGIGTLLLDHSLKFASEQKIKRLILYSNTRLEAAVQMYRKYGFYAIELESGIYERADIKMEKLL
jgi:ribosomal protein S18 acetylase RimI-like enzyme